jgi:hypothetical protein
MNPNDVPNMLYSILVFLAAISGAWNLHLLVRLRIMLKECRRLEIENEDLKCELQIKYAVDDSTRTKQ